MERKNRVVSTMILLLVFILTACKAIPTADDTLTGAFIGEVAWESCGTAVKVSIDAENSFEGEKRDVTLRLIEPSELSGAEITRKDGNVSGSFEGIELSKSAASAYLDIVDILLDVGELKYIGESAYEGVKTNCFSNENSEYEWHFSADSGKPLCVKNGEIEIRILWTEKKGR